MLLIFNYAFCMNFYKNTGSFILIVMSFVPAIEMKRNQVRPMSRSGTAAM